MTQSVEEYLGEFSGETLNRLQQIREIVNKEAPKAVPSISYGLLAWKLNGKPLIYAGGFAKHIGLYATPQGHEAVAEQLAPYKQGKGSVQFPLNKPFPADLIQEIVQIRVQQLEA